jgi:hypothetical protein
MLTPAALAAHLTAALVWFTGKSRAAVESFVIPALVQSAADGCWQPGASRKVHAALTKVSGATQNLGKLADGFQDAAREAEYGTPAYDLHNAWFAIMMAFRYGNHVESCGQAVEILEATKLTAEQKALVAQARAFVADLAPIWATVSRLDATRPKPVFTALGLSPTVTKTLTEQLKLNVATLRMPEYVVEYVEEEVTDKHGRTSTQIKPVLTIKWPEGTCHGRSRFAHGNLCHACGHAIKNAFNWVPFLMDDAAGVPHSMWVGRDCARNVFNVDVKGDAEYATNSREGK